MNSVRAISCSIGSFATFEVPILAWNADVPARFFNAVYSALKGTVTIRPDDFFVANGMSLGDCKAGFRVLGGANTLELTSNSLVATFPYFGGDQAAYVDAIILQTYAAVLNEFSEIRVDSIRSDANHHLALTGGATARDLLAAGAVKDIEKRSKNSGLVEIEPAIRFRIVDKNSKWNCRVGVEFSEYVAGGLFTDRSIMINDLTGRQAPDQQFKLVRHIEGMILELLQLEYVEGDSNATKP